MIGSELELDFAGAFPKPNWRQRLAFLRVYWKSIVIVLAPLLYLPLFLTDNTPSKRCMYVVILMITYWVTEALPLAISSMLPILLFPVLDIMSTDKITLVYMKEPVVMLIAGIMIALSIEFCNLHTRVALKVVQLIGCSQRRLHFGLMVITMFISMWISNTATISMMCPIVLAVLQQMEAQGLCEMYEDPPISGTSNINIVFPAEPEPKRPTKITLCYMLGIAYATSIGGTGTLVGTGPNMAFKGIFESEFPALSVSFPNWMASVSVTMLISTVLTFVWLQVLYMGMFRPNSKAARAASFGAKGEEVASETINERYKALGPMSSHEIAVGCLFLLAVILFVSRRPGFAEGWADAIISLKTPDVGFDEFSASCATKPKTSGYRIKDSTAAVFVLILLFIFPTNWRCLRFFKKNPGHLPTSSGPALLTWKYAEARTPWNLIFLLGGGFAIAEGGSASGMSKQIGDALSQFQNLHPIVILIIVAIFCKVLTEFSTNTSVANIALPILANLSKNFNICPMYLMLPITVICSFAFHFPVGTPPNAIAAAKTNIQNVDMMIAGIGPSVITFFCCVFLLPFWSALIFPAEFDPFGYPNCGI